MSKSSLKIKAFHITSCQIGKNWQISPHELTVKGDFAATPLDFVPKKALEAMQKISIRLLPPGELAVKTNTIMDIVPISTKVIGSLGNGITHTLTGVSLIITGAIDGGEQFHEFGSSEGTLKEHLKLDRAGTPQSDDYIILIDFLAKRECSFTRELVNGVFALADAYLGPLRKKLKFLDGRDAAETFTFEEKPPCPAKPNVVLIKQVAGQGAMYDTLLFPKEPSGFLHGLSIIDLGNMPVFLTPNEYRDGAIRALV